MVKVSIAATEAVQALLNAGCLIAPVRDSDRLRAAEIVQLAIERVRRGDRVHIRRLKHRLERAVDRIVCVNLGRF